MNITTTLTTTLTTAGSTLARRNAHLQPVTGSPATHDPKVDRILGSWLGGSLDDGHWLASIADEVIAPAGSELEGGRFVYVVLDDPHGCTVVGPGVATRTIGRPSRVLVFATSELAEAADRFPRLQASWEASLATCPAAA